MSRKTALLLSSAFAALMVLLAACAPSGAPPSEGAPPAQDVPPAEEISPPQEGKLQILFGVEPAQIAPGECATLHWEVAGPHAEVIMDSIPLADSGEQEVCPPESTVYFLQVVTETGVEERQAALQVGKGAPPAGGETGETPPASEEPVQPAPTAPPAAPALPAYEAGSWMDLGGPPGGIGYDIRVNPDNPNEWFVTDVAAGVSKSTDGGRTWTRSNRGIATDVTGGVPIFCLTIDPHDSRTIWTGTYLSGHLYRSTDGGQTWEERDEGISHDGRSFRGITIDPNNPHTVYAAGEVSGWVFGGGEKVRGEVYRSDDDGAHWRLIWSGDNLARYVWVDPRDSNRLYVSTGIFDRTPANSAPERNFWGGVGILRSEDGGQTWEVLGNANGLPQLNIPSLFMHPENPDLLIAAVSAPPPASQEVFTQSGVYVTYDGGDTWQAALTDPVVSFDAVEISEANPNVWYAAGHEAGNSQGVVFWRSDDAGKTWSKSHVHTEARTSDFAIDIQVDPRDPHRVFINNYGGGNFLSEDGGKTWVDASKGYTGLIVGSVAVAPWDSRVVFVNNFRSDNGGDTWGAAIDGTTPVGSVYRFVPQGESDFPLILGGSPELLYRSEDGGKTWTSVMVMDIGLEEALGRLTTGKNPMNALAIAPSDPRIMYAGFVHYDCLSDDYRQCVVPAPRIYRSHDGGRTWEPVEGAPFAGVGVISLTTAPDDPKTVYAGTGKGLFVTHDGGDTWQEITALSQQVHQLPTPPEEYAQSGNYLVFDVVTDPFDPDTLYVGIVDYGVWRSRDGGQTWEQASNGMNPNETVLDIVADPNRRGVLYAASAFSGVFYTTDGGDTWRAINDGLNYFNVHYLGLSADGSVLYAGTSGRGVFRLGTPSGSQP